LKGHSAVAGGKERGGEDHAAVSHLQDLRRAGYAHGYGPEASAATIQPCSRAVVWIPGAVGRLQHLQDHHVP